MGRLLIAAAVTLALALAASPAPRSQSSVEDEEYAVYSALISQRFVREKTKQLVILNKTTGWFSSPEDEDTVWAVKARIPEASESALYDFTKKNKAASSIERRFKFQVKYTLISSGELDGFFKDGFPGEGFERSWKQFYEKYPGAPGYIQLSRVGFDKEKGEAVVYVGSMCDQLCGGGSYVRFVRKDGGWKVEQEAAIWVS